MGELRDDQRPAGLPTEDDLKPRTGGDVVSGDEGGAGPIADRLGRDPGNLGDEIPAAGDITHPIPEPSGGQM